MTRGLRTNRMRPLLCLILLAAGSLFASEVTLSPPVVTQATGGSRIIGATDGTGVLAVWSDVNRLRYALIAHGTPADVPARLLTSIEDDSRPIPDDGLGFDHSAAFAAGRYLVVWHEQSRIEAAVIDRDGEVRRRFSLSELGSRPVIASASGCFLVGWTTADRRGALAIVSPDGEVLSSRTLPFPVRAACASVGAFAVLEGPQRLDCSTATNCTYRHAVMRIAPDGSITAQANVDVVADWQYPPIAYSIASGSDGGILIAYAKANYPYSLARGVGLLLDFGLRRVSANFDFGEADDDLTTFWDRSNYVVVTIATYYGARAMRVGIDSEPIDIGLEASYGSIVPADSGYFVFVVPAPLSIRPIPDPIELTFHTDLQLDPSFEGRTTEWWRFTVVVDQSISSIATDGRSILAGWSLPYDTRKNALVSDGTARDLSDSSTYPLTFDGREFVSRDGCVETGSTICGAAPATMRFRSADGIAAEDVTIKNVTYAIWNGKLFFALGLNFRADPWNYPLTVARFSRSGELIGGASVVAVGNLDVLSTATNGRDAFFVLSRLVPGPYIRYENVIGRVTSEGSVSLSEPIELDSPKIAAADDVLFVTGRQGTNSLYVMSYTADLRPRWPAGPVKLSSGDMQDIAADGRNAVVVWREPGRIAGARVTPEGNAVPFVVAEGADPLSHPRVASARGATAVAYERLVSEPPYVGARQIFVKFLDAPLRHHAAAH